MLNTLPEELLIHIFTYLPLKDLIHSALLNHKLYTIARDNGLWKPRCQLHFEEEYLKNNSKDNVDWFFVFTSAYKKNYRKIPGEIRSKFSHVKEGKTEYLNQYRFIDFFWPDKRDQHLVDWAKKRNNDKFIDRFYELAEREYHISGSLDTKSSDDIGRTILYWSLFLRRNNAHILHLLSRGSELTERYLHIRYSPLHIAAREGLLETVIIFLNRDIRLLNEKDRCGQTALIWASANGHYPVVEKLLTYPGIKLNARTKGTISKLEGMTALSWASMRGFSTIVSLLLRYGEHCSLGLEKSIYFAIKKGYADIVRLLVEHDKRLAKLTFKKGKTALMLAVAQGSYEVCEYLLSINLAQPYDGDTAIYIACQSGFPLIVELLLKTGANLNNFWQHQRFNTIYFKAAIKGKLEALKIVLKFHPGYVHLKNSAGETALHIAARTRNLEFFNYLIELGADTAVQSEVDGSTVLHIAASLGDINMTQSLSHSHILVNQLDHLGRTPLIIAAAQNHLIIVEILLKQSPDLNVLYSLKNDERTALHHAVENKNINMTRLLLKAGADPSLGKLFNVIHIATIHGQLEIVKLVLNHQPALLNSKDSFGRPPIFLAVQFEQEPIASYLLAQPKIELDEMIQVVGKTTLHWLVCSRNAALVKKFLQAGADPRICFAAEKTTLIHIAVKNYDLDTLKILIEYGKLPLVNKVDAKGKTALMLAVETHSITEIVAYLLTVPGINLYLRSKTGKMAIHYAANNYNIEIVKLLLKHSKKPILPPLDGSKFDESTQAMIYLQQYHYGLNLDKNYAKFFSISFQLTCHDKKKELAQVVNKYRSYLLR